MRNIGSRIAPAAKTRTRVRLLVGTLVAVGEGRIDPNEIPGVLAARDRSRAGHVAPPHGLTLERVSYRRQ